jgi:hypothetical protein
MKLARRYNPHSRAAVVERWVIGRGVVLGGNRLVDGILRGAVLVAHGSDG